MSDNTVGTVSAKRSPLPLLFAGVIAIYVTGFLAWYSLTPLGRYPVLDDREILALARQIAERTLPLEAFYRAPLYSALLAIPLVLGLTPTNLVMVARVFNALCHLATTYLVWRSAGRIAERRAGQYLAASLVGFNPVLLHFCGDALDITAAITALVLGVAALLRALDHPPSPGTWALASLWLGIGTLLRPQLLPVLSVLPLLAIAHRGSRRSVLAALAPGLLCLLALGCVNAELAGDFRLLPWQGAYNFWSANRPGAHGRYFEQSISIASVDDSQNPARLESEILYHQRHPRSPDNYQAQTAYWQSRALSAIREAPAQWLLLLAHKAFYALNNVEQYNNKTYSFQRARSPWLRWNPLCWTLVLCAGLVGFIRRWSTPSMRALATVCAMYTVGLLLYFVSDRFRAPLIPLLALASSGAWQGGLHRQLAPRSLIAILGVAVLSGYPLNAAEQRKTEIQDIMAIAKASDGVGDYPAALVAATEAVALAPTRPAALRLLCVVRFNAWLHAEPAPLTEPPWSAWRETCSQAVGLSPTAARILGYIEWRLGPPEEGRQRWQALARGQSEERDNALAWLALTGPSASLEQRLAARRSALPIQLALAYQGDARAARELSVRYPPAALTREFRALHRLFDRAAH